jgi:hypothetical protein
MLESEELMLKSVLFCLLALSCLLAQTKQTTPEQTSTTNSVAVQKAAETAPEKLEEKFDAPSDKWLQTDKCHVSKGKYWVNEECMVPVGKQFWDDFELTVVAAAYSGGERSNNQTNLGSGAEVKLPTFGIIFRNNQQGYYRFLLAPLTGGKEGVYKLTKEVNGKQTELSSWRRDLIITMRNEIKLRCVGGKIEISVNALRLANFSDADLKAGQISLFFLGGMGSFDDLVIKKLKP